MAWRIDEQVVRGEIDNRERGRVTGRLWFVGREEAVVLELEGDCWRDLAGRHLEFTNPEPKPGDVGSLQALQRGAVGDISASRKVRVPDIPIEEIGAYYKAKKPFPWHWGNSLYLEWFSAGNGRVVIETASFDLRIVGDATWEMSEAEEAEQRKANGAALAGFMDRLMAELDAQGVEIVDDTPVEWNEAPQTEEEAEAEQARSDLLADRIAARIEREGEDADYEKILEEELDRIYGEEGAMEPTPEDEERNAAWIEEMNRAAEEALASPEAEWEERSRFRHPLVERVRDFALRLREMAEAQGWGPEGAGQEHPVVELLDATMIAGAKLAGALNGGCWPPEVTFCAHTIVRLKRARGYLDDALRGAESCREERLIAPEQLASIVEELTDCAREVDALIAELRAKLERGTD